MTEVANRDPVPDKAREIIHAILGTYAVGEEVNVHDVKDRVYGFLEGMGQELWYKQAFGEPGWSFLISMEIARARSDE